MNQPEPGIYYDIPFDQYCDWQALNISTLLHGRRSMLHLKAAMDGPPMPRTVSMATGTLGHTLTLEPARAMQCYIVMPDYANDPENVKADGTKSSRPTSTAWYKQKAKDFAAANITREVVTQDQYDNMLGMLQALAGHDKARTALAGGQREVSLVWVDADTGILRKGRLDLVDADQMLLLDLKVTDDASRFENTIDRFGYHIRMASYREGWLSVSDDDIWPWLLAVEPKPPFGIRYAAIGKQTLAVGRCDYRLLITQYQRCIETGEWPGYEDPSEWNLPGIVSVEENYGLKITTEAP